MGQTYKVNENSVDEVTELAYILFERLKCSQDTCGKSPLQLNCRPPNQWWKRVLNVKCTTGWLSAWVRLWQTVDNLIDPGHAKIWPLVLGQSFVLHPPKAQFIPSNGEFKIGTNRSSAPSATGCNFFLQFQVFKHPPPRNRRLWVVWSRGNQRTLNILNARNYAESSFWSSHGPRQDRLAQDHN